MKTNYRAPEGCHNCKHGTEMVGWCAPGRGLCMARDASDPNGTDTEDWTVEGCRQWGKRRSVEPYGICDDYEKLTEGGE